MILLFLISYVLYNRHNNHVKWCEKNQNSFSCNRTILKRAAIESTIVPVASICLIIFAMFYVLFYKIRKKYSTINQNDPEIEISNKDPAGQTGDKQADKIPTSLSETDVQPNEINMQSEQ